MKSTRFPSDAGPKECTSPQGEPLQRELLREPRVGYTHVANSTERGSSSIRSNLNSSTMLKTTRLAIGLLAATLGLALGCNNEKAPKPPEPLSSVHPAEKPTSPAVPPSVGTSRSVSSDASAYDQITEILTEHDVFSLLRYD